MEKAFQKLALESSSKTLNVESNNRKPYRTSPSYGIYPLLKVDNQWHVILQVSFSASLKTFKVDPFRGKQEASEAMQQTASRETKEESCMLLNIAAELLSAVPQFPGMFTLAVSFEDGAELLSFARNFDHNLQVLREKEDANEFDLSEVDGISIETLFDGAQAIPEVLASGYRVSSQTREFFEQCGRGRRFDPEVEMRRMPPEEALPRAVLQRRTEGNLETYHAVRVEILPENFVQWKQSPAFFRKFRANPDDVVSKRRREDAQLYPSDYIVVNGEPVPKNRSRR
eukprot:ANDGO_02544.mRNA.1 hypothetical protein PTSG_09773